MERRNTIQKKLVLETVQQLQRHITADEVYQTILKKHPKIGKGTVYRNLNILVEEGKIRKIEIPNGSDFYDFTLKNHYHVRCLKCQNLFDVDMDEIDNIYHLIHDTHGFKFLDYDILFKGICPNCSKKEEE